MILAATLWTVTAYCEGTVTKAGTTPVAGHVIAADPAVLPIGSIVRIDGWPGARMVQDTGSLVRGRHVDVYVETCDEARAWGRQAREVLVLHRPAERNGSGKRETSEPGARRRESSAPRLLPVIEPGPGAVEAPRTGICERSPGCSGSIRGSELIEARR